MKKAMLTVMAVFFVAAVATSAFAFGCGRGPGYGPCPRGGFQGPAGLNLTAEQTAKIREIRDAQLKEIKPLQEQTFIKRDEIRKLWLEPNPDQAKILAAQKEMRTLRDQIEDKTTAFYLEAAKILTPEQRDKIKFLGERRVFMNKRASMYGFGPRPRFGPRHEFRPMRGFGFGEPGGPGWFGCPGL
ncbi:MAG: Spy/CpxP family protein refolding chaperone [Deltaproteobacteria bacterium]|nr:Spy/CpxP family protein refolding chaperone [Deltaproteobacteria bacterium]